MDVSFSAWQHSREESMQLKGDSFSFLFDRRYTNRLNRMSRVFFEAYVVATKELAAQEDRFPSLSEIDAKMESGAVYAFKDRLVKNTEFFEEIKISGVSYLVPRALKFVDASGTYTDLILIFEEGAVVLPTRRKTPSPPGAESPSLDEIEDSEIAEPEEVVPIPPINPAEFVKKGEPETKPEQYPMPVPEPFEGSDEPLSATSAMSSKPEPTFSKRETISSSLKEPTRSISSKKKMEMRPFVAILVGVVVLLVAAVFWFYSGPLDTGSPSFVRYSAYLSNSSNESYLGLDVSNPSGMANEIEMVLPPNIDQSISARGGIVTISHANNTLARMNASGDASRKISFANNTLVRMNASSDASVKIYLQGNWTTVPLSLNLFGPSNFDTSIEVHGKDYLVTRKNETLVLTFNLTQEGVSFEQIYRPKY
jgi:hypothetical protein